jgi:hypothetical protein
MLFSVISCAFSCSLWVICCKHYPLLAVWALFYGYKLNKGFYLFVIR